jgi:5-methylcytosine-specific restriction protein A
MPRRTRWTVCSVPGCPDFTDRGGKCPDHRVEAEQARGTARQRGYGREHETRFRPAVLARDPVCVCPGCPKCTEAGDHCTRPSIHADHWPIDRRQLVQQGLDPNDPRHGRGLCGPCHASSTAQLQPGGFNQ